MAEPLPHLHSLRPRPAHLHNCTPFPHLVQDSYLPDRFPIAGHLHHLLVDSARAMLWAEAGEQEQEAQPPPKCHQPMPGHPHQVALSMDGLNIDGWT